MPVCRHPMMTSNGPASPPNKQRRRLSRPSSSVSGETRGGIPSPACSMHCQERHPSPKPCGIQPWIWTATTSRRGIRTRILKVPRATSTRRERRIVPSPHQSASSNSVRVSWLDQEGTIESLRRAMAEVKVRSPEIDRVLLFGSLARGDAAPGSDADLLIILRDSDLPFLDRFPRYRPAGVAIDVDVFAYTREELRKMLASRNRFVRQALREGVELL